MAHIAQLANLTIIPEEEKKFGKQLAAVLGHIEKLSEVDVTQVAETSQVTGMTNVVRADTAQSSLSQEDAVNQAAKSHNGLILVPVIIREAVEE